MTLLSHAQNSHVHIWWPNRATEYASGKGEEFDPWHSQTNVAQFILWLIVKCSFPKDLQLLFSFWMKLKNGEACVPPTLSQGQTTVSALLQVWADSRQVSHIIISNYYYFFNWIEFKISRDKQVDGLAYGHTASLRHCAGWDQIFTYSSTNDWWIFHCQTVQCVYLGLQD